MAFDVRSPITPEALIALAVFAGIALRLHRASQRVFTLHEPQVGSAAVSRT